MAGNAPNSSTPPKSCRIKLQIGMNGYAEKRAGFGMLETGTRRVRAMVVPDVKRTTLQKAILDNVGFGSTIHTDRWPGYDGQLRRTSLTKPSVRWKSSS
jgi:ISXO2-like transposase domain